MAKYGVTYSCGHEGSLELYGPHKERAQKIEWYENTAVCPACYKERMRAEEAAKPITMEIKTNGLDKDAQGNLLCEIILTGGTITRKDEIKALGYRWMEVRGGVMDFFATNSRKAWVKHIPLLELEQHRPDLVEEAQKLGAEIKIKINALDIEMARRAVAADKEIADKIAAIPKPEKPACHPLAQHPGGRWNEKYYGNDRTGYRYYMDNQEYRLTAGEYDELVAYRKALADWQEQVGRIKAA